MGLRKISWKVLYILVLIFSVSDILATAMNIAANGLAAEANPLMRHLIGSLGIFVAAMLKIAWTSLLFAGAYWTNKRYCHASPLPKAATILVIALLIYATVGNAAAALGW